MMTLAAGLASAALLLLVWSYLLYPAVIARLAGRARQEAPDGGQPSSLEIILSAADEEDVISDRVENLLHQESSVPLSVSIGCDGCRDRTPALASDFARAGAGGSAARVRVVEFPDRRGKAAVLNDLLRGSEADVVVFTDANTRFEPGAVEALALAFGDPSVGAACGRLILESGASGGTPESVFWDRETRVKMAEGRLGVCLGANGAIYAARRAWIEPLPPATTSMDDFLIPARIARQGKRVVFTEDAVAREEAGRDVAAEISRRFRIGIGAGRVLRQEPWLFNLRRHGLLSFAFLSRKAARWIAPLVLLGAAVAALGDVRLRSAGAILLAAALLLPLSAAARPRLPGLLGKLYYFWVINVALAAGVVAGLAGYRRPAWRPIR
jgi:cellulose synthase/poly-beta-1,6-N-acetylglucosamine synthase-like glycosyltransferase